MKLLKALKLLILYARERFDRNRNVSLFYSCTNLPLQVFIQCLCYGNCEGLVISGNPKPEQIKRAWASVLYDFEIKSRDLFNSVEKRLILAIGEIDEAIANLEESRELQFGSPYNDGCFDGSGVDKLTSNIKYRQLLIDELFFIEKFRWHKFISDAYFEVWMYRLSQNCKKLQKIATIGMKCKEMEDYSVLQFLAESETYILTAKTGELW